MSEIKAAGRGDLTVGGPALAAEALRLDLVDVVELLWCPVLLGGGVPVLAAGVRRDLRLRSEQRLGNGVIQATYEVIGHERSGGCRNPTAPGARRPWSLEPAQLLDKEGLSAILPPL